MKSSTRGFLYTERGLSIGAVVGPALGLLLDDLALGIILGPIIGFALGLILSVSVPKPRHQTGRRRSSRKKASFPLPGSGFHI